LNERDFKGEKLMNKKRLLVIVGIVTAAVLLSIPFNTMLANHRPAITSLEAPERVISLESCQITCNASDRDGDELSYNWSANAGEITGAGATVNWTAPLFIGSYNVTVTVTDSRGGEVMKQVTIKVRTNRPPTITSLVADAVWTTPSGNIQATCTASDPDGNELNYEWSTTGGDISGTGPVVNWTAPQEAGIYDVTVVVTDGHGEEDMRIISLSAALRTPPTIEDLIVTAEHKYLKKSTSGYDYEVWTAKQYNIECMVSNTSGEVSYNWSCDSGEISGEGSMITWTAPNEILIASTVTVTVSDITGNKVSKSIVLYVPSCACGF
jgi:hypothetical protein